MNQESSWTAAGRDQIIERQMLLWHARRKAARDKRILESQRGYRFITIARDEGSFGDDVAHGLGERLGWHVFDSEIVDYIAKHSGVRETLVEELDERSQGLISDAILRLLRMSEGISFGVQEYHTSLMKTLAFLSTQGESILVGRGANFALRDEPRGLHVRLFASPEIRVRRLTRQWQVSEAEARRRMEELDKERLKFTRRHYKVDPAKLRFCDMVFVTDYLSVDTVVESVIAAMEFARRPPVRAASATTGTEAGAGIMPVAKPANSEDRRANA